MPNLLYTMQAALVAMASMRWELTSQSDDGVIWRGEHESVAGVHFLPLRRSDRKLDRWCDLAPAYVYKCSWFDEVMAKIHDVVKAMVAQAGPLT